MGFATMLIDDLGSHNAIFAYLSKPDAQLHSDHEGTPVLNPRQVRSCKAQIGLYHCTLWLSKG